MLIIGAITVLTNGGYVSNEYAKPDFPTDPFGFTPEERLSHASDNLRYLRESLPSAFLEQQKHNGQPLYNTREVSHMADVQSVFQAAWTGGKMLLVFFLFLTTLITWRGRNSHHFFAGLQYGGILSASLIAVIAC